MLSPSSSLTLAHDSYSSVWHSHGHLSSHPVSSDHSRSDSSLVSSLSTSVPKESPSPLDSIPSCYGCSLAHSSNHRCSPFTTSRQVDCRGHSHSFVRQQRPFHGNCSASRSCRSPSSVAESSCSGSSRSSSVHSHDLRSPSRASSRCSSHTPGGSRHHSHSWLQSPSRQADEDRQEEHLSMELVDVIAHVHGVQSSSHSIGGE